MFIDSPNKQELRQGDIFTDLYFPIMPCQSPRLVGTAEPSNDINQEFSFTPAVEKVGNFQCVTAQVPLLRTAAMLISQCCDVAFDNRGGNIKRRYLVIAPLTEVPSDFKKNPAEFELLTQNRLDDYLNYFYVPQIAPLSVDYLADFSRVVSIPSSQAKFILERKVLQMSDPMRVRLKVKFSSFFGRPIDDAEEELVDQLRHEIEQQDEAQHS